MILSFCRADKRAIIVLNIERNMKAEDHIQYNDIFNKRLDKWNPSEQGVLSNEGWTKDRFPEWKEKEQTRQTENIKIWEVDPEKLKDVQENYTLVANEDLEFLFGGSNYKSNEKYHALRKKYLEEDHE